MNCTLITTRCLSCNGQEYWKGHNNPKFPQTDASFNQYQTRVIGGIFNSRNTGLQASSFTILKKSLTVQRNTSGPGDLIKSIPIMTSTSTSGIKSRLNISQPGVDVKHGSYERYLARKRGLNIKCQGC
jgi:hypothetical protein